MKAPSRRMSGVLAAGAVALAVVSGTAGAALALPTPVFAATTSASELVVNDNYPSLYGWINNKLNDATSIKISTSACGVSDNGNGTTVIPTQVKSMTGWQQSFWESEGKAYCNNMAVHYKAAMEKLASAVRDEAADNGIAPAITAAMAPLDPRLGEEAEGLGLEWLLKNVEVLHAFPMHLWKRFETIDRFRAAYPALAARVVRITADGESFEV